MLRFLFCGLGGVGQRHLRNLRSLCGAEADISAYRVRGETQVIGDRLEADPTADVVSRYGVRVFHDLDAALDAGPDVVFVTNPNSEHIRVALPAAERGCHLFIEKPLSHDLSGVDDLIGHVEAHGSVGFVAYQLRQHPGFCQVQNWLGAGAVGRVLSVRAEVGEYLPGFHPYEDYRRMYASRAELGGGVTLTQIHELDYLYALFGLPKRVFSIGGHVSSLEVDVEDVASSLLEYAPADGRVLPVHVYQDYFQRPKSRSCRIVGERGRIDWSLSEATAVRFEGDRLVEQHSYSDFDRNQMFVDELAHFLACVRGEERPAVTLRDGAASLRMGLALLESQRSNQPVALGGAMAEAA